MGMEEFAGQPTEPYARPALVPSGPGRMPLPDTVMAVIDHDAWAGAVADSEAWLQHLTACVERFRGYVGVTIIRSLAGSQRCSMKETSHGPISEGLIGLLGQIEDRNGRRQPRE